MNDFSDKDKKALKWLDSFPVYKVTFFRDKTDFLIMLEITPEKYQTYIATGNSIFEACSRMQSQMNSINADKN